MVSKTFRRSLPPFQCCRTGSAHRLYQGGASWRGQVTQPVWSIASLETRKPPHIKLLLRTVPNVRSCSFHYLNRLPECSQHLVRRMALCANVNRERAHDQIWSVAFGCS